MNEAEKLLELKVTRFKLGAKTKNGDEMYGYVLLERVNVNGSEREIRVDFVAKDIGGYEMLDIIFMFGDEAYLSVREESMKDEKSGVITNFMVYEIWNVDKDGIPYVYKVKPMRESDKAKLNVILNKRKLAYERAKAAIASKESSNSEEI